jgi:protein-S-isoprenylcysteine O-methyltransferase Ste14
VLGATLVASTVASLLGFVLVVVSLWQKGRMEERFLLTEFGEEYAAYRRRVKSMILFIL